MEMQKRLPHPGRALFLSLSLAFLLASPSASPSHEEEEEAASAAAEPYPLAFSNSSANGVRREGLDTALRKYAFMALSHARTGVIYNVSLPPFLDGVLCQAMRVRAGSARRRGLLFNEFAVPPGIVVQTGGPFVIMVYRKIFNFTLYSAPPGYALASPVVGIVIYTNLDPTVDNLPLPEMTVLSANSSIVAKLSIMYESLGISRRNNSVRFGCAYYDINGTASFTNISVYPNICSFKILTDVAIIVPLSAIPVAAPPPGPAAVGVQSDFSKYASFAWTVTIIAAVGVIGGVALLIVVIVLGKRVRDECQMTGADEPVNEETLQTSLIGHTRAPTAAGVRTKPALETGSLHT